jgi:hypothetical protein
MTYRFRDHRKHKLIEAIQRYKSAASKVQKRGQEIVREGQAGKTLSEYAEQINIPDDSFQSDEQWENQTGTWITYARDLEVFLMDDQFASLQYSTATAAITTSGYGTSGYFLRPLPPENQQKIAQVFSWINDALIALGWDQQLEDEFIRLSLQEKRAGQDSPFGFFKSAQESLQHPSGNDIQPTAVLLTIRECINQALGNLLARRPTQEPANKASDKIKSIASQSIKDSLEESKISDLAAQADSLINELSSAGKRADISAGEITARFLEAKSFLKAFFALLDEKKLRQNQRNMAAAQDE